MPDRWLRAARPLAPRTLRESAFDPAAGDLARDWLTGRRRQPGAAGRLLAGIGLALECRRLAAHSRLMHLAVHAAKESWLMTFLTDLRRAVRVLSQQPLFAIVATLTLALGIGANVAVFSYVDAFLLTKLPVPTADRVVRVNSYSPKGDIQIVSYQVFKALRSEQTGIDLAAHAPTTVLLTDRDSTENRTAELVTGRYFDLLGLTPLRGRLLDAQDDVSEGAHPVVVIAESLWRARFASDPAIVGRVVRLNGQPFTIVGVVASPYRGTLGSEMADIWAPVMMQQVVRPRGLTLETPGWGWMTIIGALEPGTSLDRANAALVTASNSVQQRLKLKQAPAFRAQPATLLPDGQRRSIEPYFQVIGLFTLLILLAAAANLAGVMQSRVIARRRQTAIRQSLGATRWRLASEWLAESLVLAVAAGIAGVVVARGVVTLMLRLQPPTQVIGNVSFDAPFDWRVAVFAVGVALAAGLAFGFGSAWRASVVPPLTVLKEELLTVAGGGRSARWRRIGVGLQVGVSAVLLLVATLLTSGLLRARSLTPGFDTSHIALVSFRLPPSALKAGLGTSAFTPRLVEAVRALPGVTAADVTRSVPLAPSQDIEGFRIPGHPEPDGTATSIDESVVGAGYFDALGVSFVRGRTWDAAAEARRDKVGSVVINETFAKRYFAGRDPVGETMDLVSNGPVTIVGVVRDTAYYAVGEDPLPFAYIPAESLRPNSYSLMVRTSSDVDAMLPALSRAANDVDPAIVAASAVTFDGMRAGYLAPQRLLVTGAGVFATLALLLTGVGLYGVVAGAVAQRTREIGVRMALGAKAMQVLIGVFRDALVLVVIGTVFGLGAGYALSGTLRAWISGVNPLDPMLYIAVMAALIITALAATWVPARRAARIDPVTALRQ